MKEEKSEKPVETPVPAQPPAEESAEKAEDLKVPPLLLEEDRPPTIMPSDQPPKYASGSEPGRAEVEAGELPEAYGSEKLFLTARDPHTLFAHWDLTKEQQQHYNALSAGQHLVLRTHRHSVSELHTSEVHLDPESRNEFVAAAEAGMDYVAELGYYQPDHKWVTVATSNPATTPIETVSTDKTAVFGTVPVEEPLAAAERSQPGPGFMQQGEGQAMEEPTRIGHKEGLPLGQSGRIAAAVPKPGPLPPPRVAWILAEEFVPGGGPSEQRAIAALLPGQSLSAIGVPVSLLQSEWTIDKERALEALVGPLTAQRKWISSLELSQAPSQSAVSSPPGGEYQPLPGGFWFSVNAELIIYGATESSASVTFAGQPIELRADGTFSVRLAFPDGQHQIAVTAKSARGEVREADLMFSRQTERKPNDE